MARGFVYLTAVVDAVSRKVLATKVAITLEACHAEVIEALAHMHPEIVKHPLRAASSRPRSSPESCWSKACKLSMDGRGGDNVFVERLWRSVKYELVYRKAYDSVSAARADIAEYLSWEYDRSHSSLGAHHARRAVSAALPPMRLAA